MILNGVASLDNFNNIIIKTTSPNHNHHQNTTTIITHTIITTAFNDPLITLYKKEATLVEIIKKLM